MDSQKLLILSVIAALLIIGGAVVFAQFRSGNLSLPSPTTTQDSKIVVDEIMSSCTKNDQCIVVDTTCSFCCSYVAINAKSEQLFNQMFDQACKKYKGSYCECHDLDNYPTCINGKCQMVKWSAKPAAPAQEMSKQPAPASIKQPAAAPLTPPVMPDALPAAAEEDETMGGNIPEAPVETETSPPANTPAADFHDAFGESGEETNQNTPLRETTPDETPAEPLPGIEGSPARGGDDLYAPLPSTYTPPTPDNENVEVIQP
ncbi:MAG: hypothetical protein HYS17_09985 [Micavibrio aeruginosavorus]|uniref:Uncharacterized protein n=1 Tax=Micavibrio aeruginosavorus TaxID=349221 RepID=A0A7T5UGF2_9BACT|nr:MAG: hypothetical protein HYS17_09985 [Micavibrio aeruginosavorus]